MTRSWPFCAGPPTTASTVTARARSFEVEGDSVVVRGSARVVRPDGSFAETKLSWTYRFRDGLIDQISWQPRAGD